MFIKLSSKKTCLLNKGSHHSGRMGGEHFLTESYYNRWKARICQTAEFGKTC